MGYNKRSDDRPGLSPVNTASFHTGMAQAPLTLAQEANLVMKAVNKSDGCPVSTEQQGQKSKRKKTAAEASLAASNSSTGTTSAVAAGNGMYGSAVATSFNPAMAQMIGLSSNQQQHQWVQQQAMMMTMMMANPAFQAMQLAVHNNVMNRGTDGGAASSDTGASVDPAGSSTGRSSGEGITEGAADSIGNRSVPRTGTRTSNDDNDEEEHDDATTINVGTAKRGFI